MSRDASVALDFAGDRRTFRLAIGQLRALQESCDAGPLQIYRRLLDGAWRIDDLRETLRLGLIGGGTTDATATRLVRETVDDFGTPPMELLPPARAILLAALFGVPDEALPEEAQPPGEAPAATLTD
jgi:hypothetical protein